MHMKVRCRICERGAVYNELLGIYYCPHHGCYDIGMVEHKDHIAGLLDNLNQLRDLLRFKEKRREI